MREFMTNREQSAFEQGPGLLAGHPALDLLNTLPRVDGELVDLLQSDADVLHWLGEAGFSAGGAGRKMTPSSLLLAARTLRESFRRLVEKRKAGERGDPSVLNGFLAEARSYSQVVWDKSGSLSVKRVWQRETPEQMLGPLAESAAELLEKADFDLVRRCEDESCVLWFYDQTKSHHRRWCSMARCGNRNKVAAYRKRRVDGGA
jgi:predicted RNA-binding Zn ribbon-like protein